MVRYLEDCMRLCQAAGAVSAAEGKGSLSDGGLKQMPRLSTLVPTLSAI